MTVRTYMCSLDGRYPRTVQARSRLLAAERYAEMMHADQRVESDFEAGELILVCDRGSVSYWDAELENCAGSEESNAMTIAEHDLHDEPELEGYEEQ